MPGDIARRVLALTRVLLKPLGSAVCTSSKRAAEKSKSGARDCQVFSGLLCPADAHLLQVAAGIQAQILTFDLAVTQYSPCII